MKRLVVPLDGSAFAEAALPWASLVAQAHGFTVALIRVAQTFSYTAPVGRDVEHRHRPPTWTEAASYLGAVRLRLEREGIIVDTEVREGLVWTHIAEVANKTETFAVVMATHGRSGIERFILGSFAAGIIREAGVPVLLVPGETDGQSRPPSLAKIVVPLDGSILAEGALRFASGLATEETELLLVQVVAPVEGHINTGGFIERATDEAATQRLEADAESYLAGVAQSLRQSGVRASQKVVRGRASNGILDLARATLADLVVMTSHGYTGFQRWRLGSVADEVTRDGAVPVFLVTPQAIAADSPEHQLVSGFMNQDLPVFRPHDPLSAAVSRMARWHATTAPVVDDDGQLVGVVSAADLLVWRMRTSEQGGWSATGVVADVLLTDSTTVTDTATLDAVARVLVDQRLGSVVVTRENRPVGVVTMQDVLAGLGQVQEGATTLI